MKRKKIEGYYLSYEKMDPRNYYSTLLTIFFSAILVIFPLISILYIKLNAKKIMHE